MSEIRSISGEATEVVPGEQYPEKETPKAQTDQMVQAVTAQSPRVKGNTGLLNDLQLVYQLNPMDGRVLEDLVLQFCENLNSHLLPKPLDSMKMQC